MAEAPKSTNKDKAAAEKAKTPDTAAATAKDAKAKVEDAVVIGETPPKAKPAGTAAPDKAATPDKAAAAKTDKPATKPATDTAKPKTTAKTTAKTVPPPKSAAKPPDPDRAAPKDAKPATTDAPKPAKPEKRRGGFGAFLGLLLGGIAAAVIGFAAARTVVPEGWPFPGVKPEEDPLVGAVEAQGAQIAALEEQLGTLGADLDAVKSDTGALDTLRADVEARLDGLETGAAEIADRLDAMETRLSSVEKLAPEGTEAAKTAAAAYARELAALREMFEGKLAEIDAAQAETSVLEAQLAETAQAATGRAALAQVLAALDTGEPFDAALGELAEATGVEPPAALAAIAAEGAPALADLQASFAPAARRAIEADIRASVENGSLNRMEAFLRTQLGARTLEPKEGDDADAVLSRVEAALKSGDLDTVLAEIEALPEAAQPALAEWQAQARTRAEALSAGKSLADELNAK